MVELSVIRDLVAIFGVIAGFTYYVLTVRNANQNRKIDQARRLLDKNQDVENNRIYAEVMRMEWSNYDDFREKYSMSSNPDLWAKRIRILMHYNEMGYMLYHKKIDIETINSIMGTTGAIEVWNKFGSYIVTRRERGNDKEHFRWLEYTAKEMGKERARRGQRPDISDVLEFSA